MESLEHALWDLEDSGISPAKEVFRLADPTDVKRKTWYVMYWARHRHYYGGIMHELFETVIITRTNGIPFFDGIWWK